MNKKIKKLFLVILSVITLPVFANENEKDEIETMHVPLSISFVSNELLLGCEKPVVTNLSFGVIGSTLYQVNGIQGSVVYNVTKEVRGFQGAGVFNVNCRNTCGFQGSGLFNINGRNFSGVQGAGFFNINGRNFSGAQLAGVFNVTRSTFNGLQGSGVMNISGGKDSCGVQAAGVINVHKGNLKGAQLGLINVCSGNCDFQLGLINICRNGILEIGTSYTSNRNLRFTFSSGNQYLYTILGFSCKDNFLCKLNEGSHFFDDYITFAGLGTRQKFLIFNFDLEAMYNNVFYHDENDDFRSAGYLSGRVAAGISPIKVINIFAGYTAGFEHSSCCDSEEAFRHCKSRFKTLFDNGLTVHHEFDVGIKVQLK